MARINYHFEKRRKELAKKKKNEEKRERKLAKKNPQAGESLDSASGQGPQQPSPSNPLMPQESTESHPVSLDDGVR